jgi:hypothetical protein
MGARNQVGIGLSYRPASLCSLATQFQTRFLESISRPIAGLKISTLNDAREKYRYYLWSPYSALPPPQLKERRHHSHLAVNTATNEA